MKTKAINNYRDNLQNEKTKYICIDMEKVKNKQKMMQSAKKFIADKKSVGLYLKGQISIKTLHEKGIKLTMPI
jgi:hypothetical protein